MSVQLLFPNTNDVDTAGFWEASGRHQLALSFCSQCDKALHLPRAYCNDCGSFETAWKRVSGVGRLYSWTVVEHQVHPAYATPYTVVLVSLDEHPEVRLLGFLPGRPGLVVDQRMEVWFQDLSEGVTLPQWRPVTTDSSGETLQGHTQG